MTKRFLCITLLAVFAGALLSESSLALSASPSSQQPTLSCHRRNAAYRSSYYQRRSRDSKTRTALRIAAPAALGAGIGVLAGGKKGAAAGALLGGGGGALYHLFQSRRRY
jgi:hypothetical protein